MATAYSPYSGAAGAAPTAPAGGGVAYSGDLTFTTVASGVAYSGDLTFTTAAAPAGGVPATPTGLTATATAATTIVLAWTDVATTESGYAVERAPDGVSFGQIADLPANTTGYSDTGRAGSTQYWYRVRAYNVSGPSGYSNTATATTPAVSTAPSAPTGLTATPAAAARIDLAWTDPATTETGFEVERATAAAGPFAQIAVKAANATAHSDLAVTPGTPYWYRVRAVNASGPSAYSNTATATLSAPPAAPTGLTATAVSSARVDVAWTDVAGNETAYEVERSATGSGGPFTQIAVKGANATTHADGGVAASTTYWYRVRATNGSGASGYSNVATATTPAPAAQPPPPPDGSRNPGVQVLIAFDSKPTEAPVWTDVSAWVRAFSFTRGRATELEPVPAATGSLLLDNRGRRFDPTNTAGPYSGKLKKRKRVRLRTTWAGSTYDLFTAYGEDWPQRWEGPVESTVTLPLVDGLAILGTTTVDVGFPAQRSDQRIADVLDEAAWTVGSGWLLGSATAGVLGNTTVLGSAGDRVLSVGDATLTAEAAPGADGANALQLAQTAEASERGFLYVDKSGAVRFRSRHELQQQRITPLDTFGDAGIGTAELPYADVVVEAAGGPHYTRARVAYGEQGQGAVAYQDGAAVADYYPLTLSADTRLASPVDAADLARALVEDYKAPTPRVATLEHGPPLDPAALWPRLLGRDLGDVVEVRRRPPGGGPLFAQRSRIEGVEVAYTAADRIDAAAWSVRWRLTPVSAVAPWTLGDTTYSVLGTSTRLLY
jgi:hypothetical protein